MKKQLSPYSLRKRLNRDSIEFILVKSNYYNIDFFKHTNKTCSIQAAKDVDGVQMWFEGYGETLSKAFDDLLINADNEIMHKAVQDCRLEKFYGALWSKTK